ncbi:hypothetical protein CF326_g6836 [Tilletia indica]|nr:hypothetical protein CF326_g6836 [Tilletia indica]
MESTSMSTFLPGRLARLSTPYARALRVPTTRLTVVATTVLGLPLLGQTRLTRLTPQSALHFTEPAHVSLTAALLGFAARKANEEPDTPVIDCVQVLCTFFHSEYLTVSKSNSVDIHSVAMNASAFDEESRTTLLCDYFAAYVTLEKKGRSPLLPTPKLLDLARNGKAGIFALFGGQGPNEVYFNELQVLFDSYRPLIEPLIVTATKTLQAHVEQAALEGFSSFYLPGFNVHAWLTGAQPLPSVGYLGSIPVYLPLIGLTQLIQFLVSLRGKRADTQGVPRSAPRSNGTQSRHFFGDAMTGGEGVPTPMLAVSGLDEKALNKYINATNSHLDEVDQVGISLYNGTHRYDVTGQPRALCGLVTSLHRIASEYYSGVDLWIFEELAIEVRDTFDGSDLRAHKEEGVLRSIVRQIFDQPVHCGLSGIGGLTAYNLQGRRVRVFIASGMHRETAELHDLHQVQSEERWSDAFRPRLVKTEEGKLQLDTAFSRLLGRPPIMVPGMTPSTMGAGFNVAVLNAGYHIELAGGSHYNAKALRSKVAKIQTATEPEQGLRLNALFINPRQRAFQLPLWQEMRREGVPLQGFCVAAGIPLTENAKNSIAGLRDAGIEHVAFKPGSADGIRQVCGIAAANPDFPIILQWTGERAGGHHSAEDFHQPILATYCRIRRNWNISLVAGSGFGSADDFWPYLSGDCSVKKFGVEPMPFDGGWVMVAKGAHKSTAVKQLIADAPGVDDDEWEGTYDKETGGTLTVTSGEFFSVVH